MVKPFRTQSQGDAERAEALRRAEPRLAQFAQLARSTICAKEVWLFGSRTRRDSHPASDWDLLVVLDDNAPDTFEDTDTLYQLGRTSGLAADVVSVRASEAWAARNIPTTLMYQISREGIRVDA